jgi:hypothetical protein
MFALYSLPTAQAADDSHTTLAAITSPADALPSPSPSATRSPSATPTTSRAARSAAGPAVYRITVTATGYQTQLDECQWVRMDLGAEAPIVGAHTRCGGSVVLAMRPGDVVYVRGQGLDGKYVVTGSRDAHAGDNAQLATAGMAAQVILQTCYPGPGGRERLVGLEPEP